MGWSHFLLVEFLMTEPMVESPATPPAKASFAEDLVDIFVSPREVFARRADAGFFPVLLVLTLLLGALYFVNRGSMEEIMNAEFARAMAKQAQGGAAMTEAQIAAGKKVAGTMANFGALIGVPLVIFCTGLGAWLTTKMLGGSMSYGAGCLVAGYAYFPRVIESISITVQGLLIDTTALRGKFQLTLGVGRFLDPEMNAGILGLAGRVDVFTLWVTVLFAIGIVVVGKLPKEKLIPAAALMWVWGAIPALIALVRG